MSRQPKILITGKEGQLGWELQRMLAPLGNVVALDRQGLDLADGKAIRRLISDIRPNIIVNAAAYTAVDKAESEPAVAKAINGDAPRIMAEEAKKLDALMIHYSTDYVFDGTSTLPYTEQDGVHPLNVYGETKLLGERGVADVGGRHLIFRTSWVYGARGRNFLLTMLKLAKERDVLTIVDDQHGSPTWCRMIAVATGQAIASLNKRDEEMLWGTYHMTCGGSTTWYQFAKAILEGYQKQHLHFKMPELKQIATAEYPLPAKRPLRSTLSNDKLQKVFGLVLPEWDQALNLCLDEM